MKLTDEQLNRIIESYEKAIQPDPPMLSALKELQEHRKQDTPSEYVRGYEQGLKVGRLENTPPDRIAVSREMLEQWRDAFHFYGFKQVAFALNEGPTTEGGKLARIAGASIESVLEGKS